MFLLIGFVSTEFESGCAVTGRPCVRGVTQYLAHRSFLRSPRMTIMHKQIMGLSSWRDVRGITQYLVLGRVLVAAKAILMF